MKQKLKRIIIITIAILIGIIGGVAFVEYLKMKWR